MIETVNGIDLLFGAAASLGTWGVCRITEAQRRRLALARERLAGQQAAKAAYTLGWQDGYDDRAVVATAADRIDRDRGLATLLDDIRGGPPTVLQRHLQVIDYERTNDEDR